jgi:hypothetical protein
MERCQETSHAPPIEDDVTARAPHHTYQGTPAVFVGACVTGLAPTIFVEIGRVDIGASQFLAIFYNAATPAPPPLARE